MAVPVAQGLYCLSFVYRGIERLIQMFLHFKRNSIVEKRQDGCDGCALQGGWSGHPSHGDIKGNMLPGLKISIQYPSGS